MSKRTILVVCSFILLIPIMALAGDGHNHDTKNIEAINGEKATIEGTLVCKSCSLKKDFGARSDCKANGCSQALKTSDGRFIDFLDNKYAQDLKGNKYAGKQIKVSGTLYAHANIIDVQTISIKGKVISWCDNCAVMDGCASKK